MLKTILFVFMSIVLVIDFLAQFVEKKINVPEILIRGGMVLGFGYILSIIGG